MWFFSKIKLLTWHFLILFLSDLAFFNIILIDTSAFIVGPFAT